MQKSTSPLQQHCRKVLVLGDDDRMVLPIVRSLARQGIEVHLGWCQQGDPTARSRYVNRHHELPWPSASKHHWLISLNTLVETEKFDLVIPATEQAMFALQTHCEELAARDRFYLLRHDTFESVTDKRATYVLCEELQIPYPQTVSLHDADDFERAAPALGEAIIVKPTCSVNSNGEPGKAFVQCCSSIAQARKYVTYLMEQGCAVDLQRHVAGEGVGVELIAREGKILAALQHRRLHETVGHGSTYRETVELDPRLLNACERLMEALSYTGVAMVEFRVDPDSGEWALLEVNGRFWGSLPLATAAGMDFPLFLYQMLVEGQTKFQQEYQVGVRSRALARDVRWLWRRAACRFRANSVSHGDDMGWTPNLRPWRRVLFDTLRGFCGLDHIDTFAWDDPGPTAGELARFVSDALVSLRSRLPKPSVQWLQTRRLLQAQHV